MTRRGDLPELPELPDLTELAGPSVREIAVQSATEVIAGQEMTISSRSTTALGTAIGEAVVGAARVIETYLTANDNDEEGRTP